MTQLSSPLTFEVRITPAIEREYKRRGVFPELRNDFAKAIVHSATGVYEMDEQAVQALLDDANGMLARRAELPRGTVRAYSCLLRALEDQLAPAPTRASAQLEVVALPALEIHHYPPRFSSYYGSLQQLIDAKLLPDGYRFPDGELGRVERWSDGRLQYQLCRRHASADHAKREDYSADHWWLRIVDTAHEFSDRIAEVRGKELAAAPDVQGSDKLRAMRGGR